MIPGRGRQQSTGDVSADTGRAGRLWAAMWPQAPGGDLNRRLCALIQRGVCRAIGHPALVAVPVAALEVSGAQAIAGGSATSHVRER